MKLQSLIKYTYPWSVHTSIFITFAAVFSKHVFPFTYRGLSSRDQGYVIYSKSPFWCTGWYWEIYIDNMKVKNSTERLLQMLSYYMICYRILLFCWPSLYSNQSCLPGSWSQGGIYNPFWFWPTMHSGTVLSCSYAKA